MAGHSHLCACAPEALACPKPVSPLQQTCSSRPLPSSLSALEMPAVHFNFPGQLRRPPRVGTCLEPALSEGTEPRTQISDPSPELHELTPCPFSHRMKIYLENEYGEDDFSLFPSCLSASLSSSFLFFFFLLQSPERTLKTKTIINHLYYPTDARMF